MRIFKDINGREWQVTVNVNAAKRCRDLAGFELLKVVEDKEHITALVANPEALVGVLWAICQPQAQAASVTPEQFGEALGSGDVIDAAGTALLEAIADFFPPHRRKPLMLAIAKMREIQEKTAELQMKRLNDPSLTAAAMAAVQAAIDSPPESSGNASGSSPA